MSRILGWDIGGAHVKAVLLDDTGTVCQCWHRTAPVWQGIERTQQVVAAIDVEAGDVTTHAITMTAELADTFADRTRGVQAVAACLEATLSGASRQYYAGATGFVSATGDCTTQIASRNWQAAAEAIATRVPDALLVDIGTTTTDLTAICEHQAVVVGHTDAERLACHALLYTGAVRTPLMSLGPTLTWQGTTRNVIAEHFATTGDVYQLLGLLPERLLPFATADGADCSPVACARRLARTIGEDATDDVAVWRPLAEAYAAVQRARIVAEIQAHTLSANAVLLGAGSGRFVLPLCAHASNMRYQDIDTVVPDARPELADCLPAWAVAELWRRAHGDR